MFIRKKKGFTLIEVLVSLAIVGIISTGVLLMQGHFIARTNDRVMYSCMTKIATDTLNQCRVGTNSPVLGNPITDIKCDGFKFTAELIGGTCMDLLGDDTCTDDNDPAKIEVFLQSKFKTKSDGTVSYLKKTTQTTHICKFN